MASPVIEERVMTVHTLTDVSVFTYPTAPVVDGYGALIYTSNQVGINWLASPAVSFDYIPEATGGGGSIRPSSGLLYPRKV